MQSEKNSPIIKFALGQIRSYLKKYVPNKTYIIACSGGQDSLSLLLLSILLQSYDYKFLVGHINHSIRIESDQEQILLSKICQELNVPFYSRKLNIPLGSGLADRARKERKKALIDIRNEIGGNLPVLLAHTKTDQCETAIMHMIRGCGLNGLSAMEVWNSPWLRPMMRISREQTGEICKSFGYNPFDDPGNSLEENFRVHVRKNILPVFKDPKNEFDVGDNIVNLTEQALHANEILDDLAMEEEERLRLKVMKVGEVVERTIWKNQFSKNQDLRIRTLRTIMGMAGIDLENVSYKILFKISAAIEDKNHNKEFSLPDNRKLILQADRITID